MSAAVDDQPRGATAGVMVVGAQGRMGLEVRAALASEPSLAFVGALERPSHPDIGQALPGGVVLRDDPKTALEGCRVAIDFSIPTSTLANLGAAADAGVAYVTGTTGFDAAGRRQIELFAERIPVVHAPNFSLSVNVLGHLARDAPSGTALRLAEAVAEGQGKQLEDHLVLERAGETGERPAGAIGIQTLRGGDNPGEHTIYLIGKGERIELTHRAATRGHFAVGAVRAASWIIGRPPGLYQIEQVLGIE